MPIPNMAHLARVGYQTKAAGWILSNKRGKFDNVPTILMLCGQTRARGNALRYGAIRGYSEAGPSIAYTGHRP